MKKLLIFVTFALMLIGCSKERYAEINTDPSAVSKPNVLFLFLRAQDNFKSNEYLTWFYLSNRTLLPWSQITVGPNSGSETSVSFNSNTMFDLNSSWGNTFLNSLYNDTFGGVIKELQNVIEEMPENERLLSQHIYHISQIMFVQMAVNASDYNGDLIYSEALKGLYTDPPLLRPKYDTQESVFTACDNELKKAIEVLSNPVVDSEGKTVTQTPFSGQQEPVYKGDIEKWIKFANSVRLKIALRLLHANSEVAKQIVTEVAASNKYMTTNSDDYRYVSGKFSFGPNDNTWPGTASEPFVDMLKENRDPRLRFFFSKNPYNAGVIQGMLDQGKTFPAYIADEMVIDKGKFIRWKSAAMGDGEEFLGEPWVRYQGIPVKQGFLLSQDVKDSYAKEDNFKIDVPDTDNVKRTFLPHSPINLHLLQPNSKKIYPSMKKVQDEYNPDRNYNYTLVMNSAAESQLILALFGLQGVSLAGATPEQLYKNAIECSVNAYNKTAEHLNLFYYNTPYDLTTFVNGNGENEVIEKTIKLQDGELAKMFERPANQLTGSVTEKVEKCFVQLVINAFHYPSDINAYTKIGGVPMRGSTVWAREDFTNVPGDVGVNIPRRSLIDEPSQADINYDNRIESLDRQGFSQYGVLSPPMEQRYWNDKNSPNWGAGPIIR